MLCQFFEDGSGKAMVSELKFEATVCLDDLRSSGAGRMNRGVAGVLHGWFKDFTGASKVGGGRHNKG
jgi:hypothetical protein